MKRITLTIVLAALAATGINAQEPPPVPRAPRPMPRVDVRIDPQIDIDARAVAREAEIAAREAARIDASEIREATRMAMETARVEMERIRPFAEFAPMPELAPMAPMAPMPAMPVIPAFAPRAFSLDRLDRMTPPAAWAQGDPADSLYKLARDLLNRGDWGRAARMFNDIYKNYSKSAYANDAQYWEAYARYKIGTTDELRTASKILEPLTTRITPAASGSSSSSSATTVRMAGGVGYTFSSNRRTSDNDILALYLRVNRILAQRGDSDAAAKVSKYASTPGAECDQEDIQVRTEALNALSQIDANQALPILRRVIENKDECSASLRRSAVFILGRRGDAESSSILTSVAKSDPNANVRAEAISFLARMQGDAGISTLEDMLRTEQDERIQRAVIRALNSSDNARARASMRTLIDRKDAPINLRIEAINSLSSDRATTDDAAYLRGLYGKADNDRMKDAIINAVSRMGGSENDQWVLGIVRNNNESSSVRASALSRLSRSPTMTTADLAKLYDASAESYEIRQRIISILGNRKDQEATDKLIDIAKNSTVMNNRVQAINALQNKKDPRATQLLQDILDGKRP